MNERQRYLGSIITLLIGVGLLALFVSWYDDRDQTLTRKDKTSDDIRVTRTESRNLLPARIFTGSRSTVTTEETTFAVQEQGLNSAARNSRNALASRLGISTSSVMVISTESRDWPDSCLGLGQPGQFCAQVIVPGFRVAMEAQGKTYVYRTTTTGSVVAAEN